MDGRGRIAQSLIRIARLRARPPTGGAVLRAPPRPQHVIEPMPATGFRRLLQRCWIRLIRVRLPRGAGAVAATTLILGGVCYGVVKGEHVPAIVEFLEDTRDQAANTVGFSITDLTVTGHNQLTKEEVLASARVTGRSSLLFLDADATRERLKTNSWIADATVRKLLPGQLQIEIKEREPFALWQKDRRVSVIADDGTVLEGFVAPQLLTLPLVVGRGAETRAKEFPRAARPLPGDPRSGARVCPGRRAPLEPAAAQRARHPPAGNRSRRRAGALGHARPRSQAFDARYRGRRHALVRPRDRAPV